MKSSIPVWIPNMPDIMGDETQLRQVIHNLLQNAQDAVSEVQNREHYTPSIELITEKVHYQNASGKICIAVRLSVMDNETRVRTKNNGTHLRALHHDKRTRHRLGYGCGQENC